MSKNITSRAGLSIENSGFARFGVRTDDVAGTKLDSIGGAYREC